MRTRRALARLVPVFIVLTLAAAPSCSGGDEPALTESAALRAGFPEQAPRVLEGGEAFVASAAGFSRARPDACAVELPRDAAGAVIFRAASGHTVAVREVGLSGAGTFAEGAVAYRRAGGTSFWTAAPYGVEEWLHLGPGVVRRGAAAAAWELEGATARQRDGAVDVVGEGGASLLVVTAPAAYAAGGRAVGVRLEARGARIELFVDVDGEAVLVDPMWATTGSMVNGRTAGVAALLQSGKVLVTGGNVTKIAELYDPAAGTFTATGPLAFARLNPPAAAALQSGKVLVTGGAFGNTAPVTCELYDPATGTFGPTTGPLSTPRVNHTATRLPSGKVLIAGGFPPFTMNSALASAELYDPATDTFGPTGSMAVPRGSHTATLLVNGSVLIAGGSTPGATAPVSVASAELYDPATGTFTMTGPMAAARTRHAAAALKDGKVLVMGGKDTASLAGAEIFDPGAGTWTATGALAYPRFNHTATLLGSGRVLAVGGAGNPPPQVPGAISELFDPATGAWSFAGSLSTAHIQATATLLPGGSVLIAGGSTAISEVYSSQTPNGAPCAVGGECVSGFCADGVCCSTACNGGACDACSVAKGALTDGICYPLDGTPCDDGNACTQGDTCMAGACAGGNPVLCAPLDTCHGVGACNPANGTCDNPKKPEGTSCEDGDLCTQGDVCSGGSCTSGAAVVCAAPDQCHLAGTCNPTTGVCFHPKKLDGAACDDGDICTQTDTCQAGVCVGGSPKECPPAAACHGNKCAPSTGMCVGFTDVDGAPCSTGDLCVQGNLCMAGTCVLGTPITCKADACHNAGTCDPATGMCGSTPAFPDGASCPGGTCVQGICTAGTSGSAASTGASTSSGSGGGGAGGGNPGGKGCGCEAAGEGGDRGGWGALALLLAAAGRRRRSMTRVGG